MFLVSSTFLTANFLVLSRDVPIRHWPRLIPINTKKLIFVLFSGKLFI